MRYVESGGGGTLLPPETTDAEAFSPVLGETRVGRLARGGRSSEAAAEPVPEGVGGRRAGTGGSQCRARAAAGAPGVSEVW